MDPVSFTASLLTLIAAAGQSCKVVSEFVLDIHDAPKDIHAQSDKLQCLRQSFGQLLGVFKALPPDLQLHMDLQQKLVSFTHEIDSFTAKIQRMGIRLDQGRARHVWERVKWLASDRDLKRFNQSLAQWDRIFAAAASAAQLSMLDKILVHTGSLVGVQRGGSRGTISLEQAVMHLPEASSNSTHNLQVPKREMPERLRKFLSTFCDAVDLRIQERLEYLGQTITAIVHCGPVMVRTWSNTGHETYRLMPAAEAYGLASVFQLTRLLPGRILFKIFATYSASNIFQIDVRWRLNFVGLLPFDGSIHRAATTGNWLFLRDLLVNKEIKVTHQTIYGDTLLHIATEYSHVELVRELLLAGGDVNATNDDGETPLHIAVKTACDYEIIRLLLKHGANLHQQTRQGRTPLHCYYNATLKKTIQYCCDEIDNTTQDYLGMTIAHYTAYSKSSTAKDLAFCMKNSANAFATRDSDGRTPLHLALQRGNIALVQYMLNDPRGRDALHSSDWAGQTPLHFATESPRNQAIDLLLDAGAFEMHATDHKGRTALHHAASLGNLAAVEKLLERGGMQDLDKRDSDGQTPLMAARRSARREVEEYLESLCGDEHGGQIGDILESEEVMCEGDDGARTFGEYVVWQKRFAIVLMVVVGVLVYAVQYANQWHKSNRVVDY